MAELLADFQAHSPDGALLQVLQALDQKKQLRAQILARLGDSLAAHKIREHWHHSNLKNLVQGMLDGATQKAHSALESTALQLREFAGVEVTRLSELSASESAELIDTLHNDQAWSRLPFADLVTLQAQDGMYVHINRSPAVPLMLPALSHVPLFVKVDSGVELEIIENQSGSTALSNNSEGDGFSYQVLLVGPGARVQHHVCDLTVASMRCHTSLTRLDQNALYKLNHNCAGSSQKRQDRHFLLAGQGAELNVVSGSVVDSSKHLDLRYTVEHMVGNTTSKQQIHNMVAGNGKCTFNGRIHIHPRASQSNAALNNKNLALADSAEINTKPELEIYNDDVRCAHGATVGQLSDDSLFYLISRGIAPDDAFKMLSHAFVRECITGPLEATVSARLLGQ